MIVKPLLVCTIKPPLQTKMIVTPKLCKILRVNDKIYETLTTDPNLDFLNPHSKEEEPNDVSQTLVRDVSQISVRYVNSRL